MSLQSSWLSCHEICSKPDLGWKCMPSQAKRQGNWLLADKYPLIIKFYTRKGMCWHVTSTACALSLTCMHMQVKTRSEPSQQQLVFLLRYQASMDADLAMPRVRDSFPKRQAALLAGCLKLHVSPLLTASKAAPLWQSMGWDTKCKPFRKSLKFIKAQEMKLNTGVPVYL